MQRRSSGHRHFAASAALLVALAAWAGEPAHAQRYLCDRTDAGAPEPVGDGRVLLVSSFRCREQAGDAQVSTLTGHQVYEFSGPNGRLVSGGGIERHPSGITVYENTEGVTALNIVDGKVTGSTGAGRGIYRAAYGQRAGFKDKTYRYAVRGTGPATFTIDITND